MHKKIVLYGQSDHDNFGDSLIYLEYINLLKRIAPEIEPMIYGCSNIFSDRLVNENASFGIIPLGAPLPSDVLAHIFVPGGYFGCPDLTDIMWQKNWAKKNIISHAIRSSLSAPAPRLIHGVEFGPRLKPIVFGKIKSLLMSTNKKRIYSRNSGSSDYANKNLGVSPNTLPDFILGCSIEPPKEALFELGIHATGKVFGNNIFAKNFRKCLLQSILKRDLNKVCIFSDQKIKPEHTPAIFATTELLEAHGINVQTRNYEGISETLKTISECKTVITTKLHVGVCAIVYKNKSICFSSHPKLYRFYKDNGLVERIESYFLSTNHRKITKILQTLDADWEEYSNQQLIKNLNSTGNEYLKSLSDFLNGIAHETRTP
ncbi:polysaccharide pyruvyl transferase family protein [Pseudomonas sp. PDM20]|uniref:polysaccharide pyruvyl transferase family protein n=1 Tax=Pseudomonas sp. PDM20 TaxID=2769254 RepID=UPI00177A768F|nr:polysaccharide pyruvyl transferase family protein [Pseudomonas sp. PDM20]MBD9683205.1 polysaccharide pyruvyl transferase family protein [Pseudomonas sp. PDM20]